MRYAVLELSDRPWPDREISDSLREVRGWGGVQQGEYEEGRIVVNTLWRALQLMREAKGQLLTTQR